ncbi:nitrite reductase small subunit NirD [Lipingzhangella sp. LS1_29]|uniref:Nitrite reductase small subunit NirD n=1 Tax=Lipingzhangella rawalii TaxID=2055835 RepID=A0ABU2H6C9_9ACTN|nr:nitrite reductase small subunit NirD [Lipingzhangella rawalii]MDS1270862.1 nitrite reductase small subunit NirD [Lipingzhangella rawalii]
MTSQTLTETGTWVPACPQHLLPVERGVAVLLPNGAQAALFRAYDGQLYAVDNIDPSSGAAVMSRGLVGDREGEPTVASPVYKQVFSLRTGHCLNDERYRLATLPVREREGVLEVLAVTTAVPSGGVPPTGEASP